MVQRARTPVTLALLGIFQGLIILPNLSIYYFFANQLKLDPAKLAYYNGFINYVWVLKPIYGYVADSLYFCGYRRKPNLILFGALVSLGWAWFAFGVYGLASALLAKIFINIMLGFVNSISEGIMVENATNNTANRKVSVFFAFTSAAGMLSSYLGGFI